MMAIEKFPLAWRWTQPSHAVLPPEVLARIRPLNQSEAAQIHQRGIQQHPGIPVGFPAGDGAKNWLRSMQPNLTASVVVSWSQDLAIETTWEIFTEYWDDFCYPSSDDVSVLPVSGNWQLTYHHFEQFDFIG